MCLGELGLYLWPVVHLQHTVLLRFFVACWNNCSFPRWSSFFHWLGLHSKSQGENYKMDGSFTATATACLAVSEASWHLINSSSPVVIGYTWGETFYWLHFWRSSLPGHMSSLVVLLLIQCSWLTWHPARNLHWLFGSVSLISFCLSTPRAFPSCEWWWMRDSTVC